MSVRLLSTKIKFDICLNSNRGHVSYCKFWIYYVNVNAKFKYDTRVKAGIYDTVKIPPVPLMSEIFSKGILINMHVQSILQSIFTV